MDKGNMNRLFTFISRVYNHSIIVSLENVLKYVGEITLHQMELNFVSFSNINLTLREIFFVTEEINKEIEKYKLPFEVLECFAGNIFIDVKLANPPVITGKINDLIITLNMLNFCDIEDESLNSSYTDDYEEIDKSDFVQLFTNFFKSAFNKLSIEIINLRIILQFISKITNIGIAIELNANEVNFRNNYIKVENIMDDLSLNLPKYDNRIITFKGLQLGIEEFVKDNKLDDTLESNLELEIEKNHMINSNKDVIPICKIFGMPEFVFSIKTDKSFGPDKNLELSLGTIHLFISPKQINQLKAAFEIFENEVKLKPDDKWKSLNQTPMTASDYIKLDAHIKKNREENINFPESWSCQPCNELSQQLDLNNLDIDGSFYSVKSDDEEKKSFLDTKNEKGIHFTLNVDAINAILLYDDLLMPSDDESIPFTPNSVANLQNKAKEYFDNIKICEAKPDNHDDVLNIRNRLLNSCFLNHLMFLFIPFKLFFTKTFSNERFNNIIELSVGYFNLFENIKTDKYVSNIIDVQQSIDFSEKNSCSPLLVIEQYGKFCDQRWKNKSNISFTLENCDINIDFTIINRLYKFYEIFDQQIIYKDSSDIQYDLTGSNIYMYNINKEEESPEVSLSVAATNLTCILHFPVPECNLKNVFAPNLRKEIVHVDFKRVLLNRVCDNSVSTTFKIYLDEIKCFYKENCNCLKIPILRLSKTEKFNIFISLEFKPLTNDASIEPMKNNLEKSPTVFMTKSIISQCLEEKSIKKEMLFPVDVKYGEAFFNEAKKATTINLEINIPDAQISIPNKHTYEVLYNRFLIDLFVWFTEIFPLNFKERSPKEPKQNVSSSLDSSDDSHVSDIDKTILFSIGVSIGKAEALIRTPYKENGKISLGKCGEVILKLVRGNILVTNKYINNNSITYLCMDADAVAMFHQANSNIESIHSNNDHFNIYGFDNIVYRTKNGFDLIKMNKEPTGKSLLLSMETSYDLIRNVSRTILASGLFGVTINYKMCSLETSWFNQLAEVFQIEYSPISGYEHPCELTEINFIANDCLVAYNPVNLCLRSMFSISTLWVSLTSCYNSDKLSTHMFLEDSGLFLSRNLTNEILNSDFVCVLHLGFFELCHNLLNNNKSDISVSNSDIHIRTCSDSCNALMDFFIYLSNGGDLVEETKNMAANTTNISQNDKPYSSDNGMRAYMKEQIAEALKNSEPTIMSPQKNLNKKINVKDMHFPRTPNMNIPLENEFDEDDYEIIYDDEEFCVMGSELGTGLKANFASSEILNLKEMKGLNKISKTTTYNPKFHILSGLIKEMTIVWHLYGGRDFSEDEQINDMTTLPLGNKEISSSSPINQSPKNNSIDHSSMYFCKRGGKDRLHDKIMELRIEKIRVEFDNFSKQSNCFSAVDLLVKNIEVIDKITASSINKFLYEDPQYNYPTCNNGYMMRVQLKSSKCEDAPFHENNITISIRPIRLNVDQHALIHLSTFFTDLICNDLAEVGRVEQPSIPGERNSSKLTIYVDGEPYPPFSNDDNYNNQLETYINEFIFHPALPIRIDYEGKGLVNSQYGPLAALLIAMGRLNHSEIRLKALHYHPILGYNKLCSLMVKDWSDDIIKNQKVGIISGLGPMKSLAELCSGFRDLIYFPIEQYNKDGRVLTGVRRGALSFASSSAHATLDLADKSLGCLQSMAELVHDIVSHGPRDKRRSRVLAVPPKDMRDGINSAVGIISDGLGNTANTFYRTAIEEHSYKGLTGAVGGIIRQVPPAIMSPIILASEATSTIIGGLKNQINPSERRDAMDKYKQ